MDSSARTAPPLSRLDTSLQRNDTSSSNDAFLSSPPGSPEIWFSPRESPSRSTSPVKSSVERSLSLSPLKQVVVETLEEPEREEEDKENAFSPPPPSSSLAPKPVPLSSRVSLGELEIDSLTRRAQRMSIASASRIPVSVGRSGNNSAVNSPRLPIASVEEEEEDSPLVMRRTKKKFVVDSDEEDDENVVSRALNEVRIESNEQPALEEDRENAPVTGLAILSPAFEDFAVEQDTAFATETGLDQQLWTATTTASSQSNSQNDSDEPSPIFMRSAKSVRRRIIASDSSSSDSESDTDQNLFSTTTPLPPRPTSPTPSSSPSPFFTTKSKSRSRTARLLSSTEVSPIAQRAESSSSSSSEASGAGNGTSPTERLSPVRKGTLLDLEASSGDDEDEDEESEEGESESEEESSGDEFVPSDDGSDEEEEASVGGKEQEDEEEEESPVIVFEGNTSRKVVKLDPAAAPKLKPASTAAPVVPKSSGTPGSAGKSRIPVLSTISPATRPPISTGIGKPPLPSVSTPSRPAGSDIWLPSRSPSPLVPLSTILGTAPGKLHPKIPVPPSPGLKSTIPALPGTPKTAGRIAPATPKTGKAAGPSTPSAKPRPFAPSSPAAVVPGTPGSVAGTPTTNAKNRFKRNREQLAREYYKEFNRRVFDARLPADMEIEWSNKLNTTAGRTHTKRERQGFSEWTYSARIELSIKVLDEDEKLRSTLIHEMCHAAAWLLDKVDRPPHGKEFKKWGRKCEKLYPDIEVSTCHSYEIDYKFRWACTNEVCGKIYGRHSKSIDPAVHACGACKSALVFLEKLKKDGTPYKARSASAFQVFMQREFAKIKGEMPGKAHGEVMKVVAERYRAEQARLGKASEVGDGEDGEEELDALERAVGGLSISGSRPAGGTGASGLSKAYEISSESDSEE